MPNPTRSRNTVKNRRRAAGIGVEDAGPGGARQGAVVRCLLRVARPLVGRGSFRGTRGARATFDVDGTAVTCCADESYPTSRFVGASARRALDIGRPAGGTDEGFPVPISGDQDQGFGCAVFLDAPTSHRQPLRRRWTPDGANRRIAMYRYPARRYSEPGHMEE